MQHRICLIILLFFVPLVSKASYLLDNADQQKTYRLAQADVDETYDPFADYSEYDEATEEEADIHFFRNGRFVTVGFVGGMRFFTDNLSKVYASNATYGLAFTYFFDLRFALQLGFKTGDYTFLFISPSSSVGGNVSLTFISIDIKYYLNTSNISKGLADLNPYLLAGLSQVYRTYSMANTVTGELQDSKDNTMGLNGGIGLELPLMQRKAYFGVQFTFHYTNFRDANSPIYLPTDNSVADLKAKGYNYDLLGIIGLNF